MKVAVSPPESIKPFPHRPAYDYMGPSGAYHVYQERTTGRHWNVIPALLVGLESVRERA